MSLVIFLFHPPTPMSKRNPSMNGSGRGDGKQDDHRRSVSGQIDIKGRVEANLPQKFVSEYERSNSKTDKREGHRFIVECVTLLVVFVVGVFSFIQTKESIRSADVATRSLYISERAYLNVSQLAANFPHDAIVIGVHNSGHIPSGAASNIVHGITINCQQPIANCPSGQFTTVKRWWYASRLEPVSTSNPELINIKIEGFDVKLLNAGIQSVILAGVISYRDGFPDTPIQESPYCIKTIYDERSAMALPTICDHDVTTSADLAKGDGYPDHHY